MNQNPTRVRVPVYFPYTFSLVVVQLIVEILILLVVSALLFVYVKKSASGAPPNNNPQPKTANENIDWPEQTMSSEKTTRKSKNRDISPPLT